MRSDNMRLGYISSGSLIEMFKYLKNFSSIAE